MTERHTRRISACDDAPALRASIRRRRMLPDPFFYRRKRRERSPRLIARHVGNVPLSLVSHSVRKRPAPAGSVSQRSTLNPQLRAAGSMVPSSVVSGPLHSDFQISAFQRFSVSAFQRVSVCPPAVRSPVVRCPTTTASCRNILQHPPLRSFTIFSVPSRSDCVRWRCDALQPKTQNPKLKTKSCEPHDDPRDSDAA